MEDSTCKEKEKRSLISNGIPNTQYQMAFAPLQPIMDEDLSSESSESSEEESESSEFSEEE